VDRFVLLALLALLATLVFAPAAVAQMDGNQMMEDDKTDDGSR
jgi:hypothetical protein